MSSTVLKVQILIIVVLFAFIFISDWITINWSAFTRRIREKKIK